MIQNYWRRIAALSGAVLALLFVAPACAANPTSSLPYCYTYTGVCYATLGEAEAALRASVAEGERMRDTGRTTTESTGYINKHYAADSPILPEQIYPRGYTSGPDHLSDPPRMKPEYGCARTGSPWSGGTCTDMQGLIDETVTRHTPAGCIAEAPVIEGSFEEPYGALHRPPGTSPLWMLVTPGIQWYFHYVCSDGKRYRSPYQASQKHDGARFQDFTCPSGYLATSAKSVWPKLCVSSTTRTIRTLNKKVCDPCQAVNQNPIYPGTGNKARFEKDFEFAGRAFVRNYHSVMQFDSTTLAPGWTTSFGMQLIKAADSGLYIHLVSADGFVDWFHPLSGVNQVLSRYGSGRILRRITVDGIDTYEVIEKSGEVLAFDSAGVLKAIKHPASPERNLVFSYASGRLSSVTDTQGRQLSFEYLDRRLSRIVLPDGSVIGYAYDAANNLAAIDFGTGQVKRYHYAEEGFAATGHPHLLTGITAEDGRRYATFKYDHMNRPIYSALHGVAGPAQVTSAEYSTGAPATVKVTQETGETRTFTYIYVQKPVVSSIQSNTDPSRSESFEYGSSYRITKATDAKDSVTTYEYPTLMTTAVTRGVGTASQVRTEIDRSTATNLITERRAYDATGALVRREVWTYNSRGEAQTHSVSEP